MALELYRKKRDFSITPEPKGGKIKKKAKELSFVIQKHRASHMHYDFRLELNGVLLSWAVPKGPSLDTSVRRLAMQTEDHPMEYGGFEGTIPPKQYGAGTVLLWDRGVWIPKEDPVEGYQKGRLKFELEGEKLRGGWMLVKSRGGKYGSDNAWFLIKERDDAAKPEAQGVITEERPESVTSGRTLEEIAEDPDRVWHSNKSVKENVKSGAVVKKKPRVGVEETKGAVKRPLPDFVEPELATLVKEAPVGDSWLHEMKLDGYRMLTRIERGKAEMYSRNGKEWTANFPAIARCAARLPVEDAWLDGEVVVLDPDGRTSFQSLQNALSDASGKLHYFVFDMPFLNGHDLRQVPLVERKRLLEKLLESAPAALRYSAHVQGSGVEFYKQACELKLEGMISKLAQSTYRGGRCRDWFKVKCAMRQEMVIGGFTDPEGTRTGFGALLLGYYETPEKLVYAGKVGTGFNEATLTSLYRKLKPLEVKAAPFVNPPLGYEAKGVHWIRPELVGEVSFTEWTNDGTLRHPSFQGLREDKKPKDVVREQAVPTDEAVKEAPAKKTSTRKSAKPRPAAKKETSGERVAGVAISNPTKILYPEMELTKLDLARYYEAVADWMVPHLESRPLTLVRCPSGWEKQCFFQKHPDAKVSDVIDRVMVEESDGPAPYMVANSREALISLLQMGALELHVLGASSPKLDCPDRLVFDLDPAEDVKWPQLVEAVQLLRTLIEEIGLEVFIKTTGGKGLHLVVPVRPSLGWDGVKAFTGAVAELMVKSFPDRFVATMSKAKRHGKIFIDYFRNSEGATAIAPFSIRARKGAPVATPIDWSELSKDVSRDYFNVKNVPERLKKLKKDPWARFFEVKQSVTKPMLKRVGL